MADRRYIPDAEPPETIPLGQSTRREGRRAPPVCHRCAHWSPAHESGQGPGTGWCGYWEKETRRDATCDYFLDPAMVRDAHEAAAEEHLARQGLPDSDGDTDDHGPEPAYPPDRDGPMPDDTHDPAPAHGMHPTAHGVHNAGKRRRPPDPFK